MNTLEAAEGLRWLDDCVEIWIAAAPANQDKVLPETGEQMSLKFKLTKGHLTRSQKTKCKHQQIRRGF